MAACLINYYQSYDEEGRLFRDRAHNVEWRTTIHYFDLLLPAGALVFDGCAGTGNYAFWLKNRGFLVTAADIASHNVELIKEKEKEKGKLEDVFVGDISDLPCFKNNSFDVVLCMGAFYHIEKEKQEETFLECLRILKPGGILVVTYINNYAASMLRLGERLENMEEILTGYHSRTLDGVFYHTTPEEMEELALRNKTEIIKHVTSDGAIFWNSSKINEAAESDFEKYMKFHIETCGQQSILGCGLHGLLFLRK